MLLYNDSNCEISESISSKRVLFDFFRAASYAIIWSLITALNVSHKMESKMSEVSLFSRYSVIFTDICLQKFSSANRDGRKRHEEHCLGFLKSRVMAVGAWSEIKMLWYLVFLTFGMSLASNKKKSIQEYDLCLLEKKEYSLSVGCWSRHVLTKLVEVIRLSRTVEALEGLHILLADLSRWKSSITLWSPATIKSVFERSGNFSKVFLKNAASSVFGP